MTYLRASMWEPFGDFRQGEATGRLFLRINKYQMTSPFLNPFSEKKLYSNYWIFRWDKGTFCQIPYLGPRLTYYLYNYRNTQLAIWLRRNKKFTHDPVRHRNKGIWIENLFQSNWGKNLKGNIYLFIVYICTCAYFYLYKYLFGFIYGRICR